LAARLGRHGFSPDPGVSEEGKRSYEELYQVLLPKNPWADPKETEDLPFTYGEAVLEHPTFSAVIFVMLSVSKIKDWPPVMLPFNAFAIFCLWLLKIS
jgi:hypothetical protein